MSSFLAFLPESVLLLGAAALFVICLGDSRGDAARRCALAVAVATLFASAATLGRQALLFEGVYQVDLLSQILKLVLALGLLLILMLGRNLEDIREEIRPEYYLFVSLSVCGLMTLVSSIELITLIVSLQLAAFPLYLLVPMRRERENQRSQMESAIKYIMFGVAANGVMLFGMSYLYGLTGTTFLPKLMQQLAPLSHSPLAIAGLAMTFAGLFYKLAVFPFHFWSPDIYQGASNETTALISSLPKLGAVAVLVRVASLAAPDDTLLPTALAWLAVFSMCYGNLIALVQRDLKRLLGFSAIAHAGYALIGFVTLDRAGFTAAIFYMTGYLFMVLACFVVICRISADGANVSIDDLSGLHRRSPLLALTLGVGVFALAGIPPFAGFMGKLTLLSAALARGYLWLAVIAVVNTVVAVYYYLCLIREIYFRDPVSDSGFALDTTTRAVCVVLIAANLLLGVAPARLLDLVSSSLTYVTLR